MSKTLKLNNGYEMPILGLGTYQAKKGEVADAVKHAIDVGYRHIDCAWLYGNEKEVGEGIKSKITEGGVKREDLFIVTKLWNNFHEKKNVVPKLKESLKFLGLDYVDLFLIHWPFAFKEDVDIVPKGEPSNYSDVDYIETWEGMEECVHQGLAKSIGLSNFNQEQIDRVLEHCKIKPVCNQVEVNPNLNQKDLIQYCKERDIVIVGYCPLGRGAQSTTTPGNPVSTILDPKVAEIATKHNKTPAQVVLNYLISWGISVIPKSANKNRIEENFQIFDFKLDAADVEYLDSLNCNTGVSPMSTYKNHKYYPF